MSEQELVKKIVDAQVHMNLAQIALRDAKKKCMEAESLLIEAKLKKERLEEELRMFKARQVIPGQDYAVFDDE